VRCSLSLANGSSIIAVAALPQGDVAALSGNNKLYIVRKKSGTDEKKGQKGRGGGLYSAVRVLDLDQLSSTTMTSTPSCHSHNSEAAQDQAHVAAYNDIIIISRRNELIKVDISSAEDDSAVHTLETFHTGQVSSVSWCLGRPLAATLSSELGQGQLLLHNTDNGNTDLAVKFGIGLDAPVSLSLHPTGHIVLIAAGSQLLLQYIVADGLRYIKCSKHSAHSTTTNSLAYIYMCII